MNKLLDELAKLNPDAMIADGFDEAVIGLGSQYPNQPVAIYDFMKCVEVLLQKNNWSYEEAVEWMDYNVICAYVGEGTPIFMLNEV
jgi:hypothetical protein